MTKLTYTLDPRDICRAECVLASGETESIRSVKKRTGCDIIVNAPIYDFDGGKIRSRFDVFGRRFGDYSAWGIGFGANGKPIWDYDNGQKNPCFVGAYSHLVIGGIVTDGLQDKRARGRTAIGMTAEGKLVIMVCREGSIDACSTADLARQMIAAGCINAINLDGSYSSQAITPAGEIVTTRPVAGYICVWLARDNDNHHNEEAIGMDAICRIKTKTYDVYGNLERGRYIAPGDKCIIGTTLTQGLFAEVTYPAGKMMRKAYIRDLANFTRG